MNRVLPRGAYRLPTAVRREYAKEYTRDQPLNRNDCANLCDIIDSFSWSCSYRGTNYWRPLFNRYYALQKMAIVSQIEPLPHECFIPR